MTTHTRTHLDRLREMAGIKVVRKEPATPPSPVYRVMVDGHLHTRFLKKQDAETFADDLASDLCEQGLVGELA